MRIALLSDIHGNTIALDAVLGDVEANGGAHQHWGLGDGPGSGHRTDDEGLARLLDGRDADLVLGGHTHRPFDQMIGTVRAVNLGSVSNPVAPDLRASYVMIEADERGYQLEHRRVQYD